MSLEAWKRTGRKKAVCFDLNRTLLDVDGAFDDACRTELEDAAGRWADDAGALALEALRRYRRELKRRSPPGGSAGRKALREAALAKALEGLPFSRSPALIRRLDDAIRDRQAGHPKLFPGTREALAEIVRTHQVALISNGSRQAILRRVTAADLTEFFPPDRVFTAPPGSRGKPAPEPFVRALAALRVRPGEALMVGDSRTKDAAGALGVGMDACLLRPGSGRAPTAVRQAKGWLLEAASLQQVAELLR
ncbi:HAD family hydrolase [Gorillibacterium sp. sgz500922]|uniref:HAD family hydrolase n=1 Tax=Gorillibacterium sp. sgz500922 TaxID=3446694 RepID=UPI003F661B20